MAALPMPVGVADPVEAAMIGPVPDTFLTTIKRSWMVPAPVKTTEPNPVEVACLVEKSFMWSDHDRAQECVRICHKHPLLWQEFLLQDVFVHRVCSLVAPEPLHPLPSTLSLPLLSSFLLRL